MAMTIDESNVLVDMQLPQANETIAERKQSREFHELREYVKARAYGSARSFDEQLSRGTRLPGDAL